MSRADQSLTSTTPNTWSVNADAGTRGALRRRRADDEADLDLDVEPPRRTEARPVLVRRLALAVRAHDVGARDDDRAGAAVVADGQVLPVRRQGLAVGPEDPARRWWRGARRSRSRRSRRRSQGRCEHDVVERQQGLARHVGDGVVGQDPLERPAHGRPLLRPAREQAVQRPGVEHRARVAHHAVEQPEVVQARERERVVPDAHRELAVPALVGDDAVGQVLRRRTRCRPRPRPTTSCRLLLEHAQGSQVGDGVADRAGAERREARRRTARGSAAASTASSGSASRSARRAVDGRATSLTVERRGRGGQDVEEAVLLEAGVRVGASHRVVQAGGELEREPAPGRRDDQLGELRLGRVVAPRTGRRCGTSPARRRPRRGRRARRATRRRAGPRSRPGGRSRGCRG